LEYEVLHTPTYPQNIKEAPHGLKQKNTSELIVRVLYR